MKKRLLAILFAAAGVAAATDGGNNFHWTGRLAPGQLIEIKGVNGSIRAESTSSKDVEVIAEKTGYRYDPADVRIQVVDNGNGTTICAIYPSSNGRSNECKSGLCGHLSTDNSDVKVEFTVRVPTGVRFTGRTVNGSVQAIRLNADVEAHTVNGKIVVSTSGAALADTVNGSIHASMGNGSWARSRRFATVNGSIEVELPSNASADLDASTVHGRIVTDFPLTVRGEFVGRSIHGTLGSGGRGLKITTVNGNITLRDLSRSTV